MMGTWCSDPSPSEGLLKGGAGSIRGEGDVWVKANVVIAMAVQSLCTYPPDPSSGQCSADHLVNPSRKTFTRHIVLPLRAGLFL